ncbi:MAG: hypothetical protein ACT4P9_12535 [Betaproteobacteria bacterium]
MRGKIIAIGALLGALFLGGGIVLVIQGTPEQQARRDVARCAEIARIMMNPETFGHHLSESFSLSASLGKLFGQTGPWLTDPLAPEYVVALHGVTYRCLRDGR